MCASLHIPRKANQTVAHMTSMKGLVVLRAMYSKWANWATSNGIFGWTMWSVNLLFQPFTPLVSKGKANPRVVVTLHRAAMAPLAAVAPPGFFRPRSAPKHLRLA